MDCQRAETAIMRYVEKNIQPADARDLTTHILRCGGCRALYLLMDETAELFEGAAPDAAVADGLAAEMLPAADFTERVMRLVRAEAPSVADVAAPVARLTVGDVLLRVLWCVSGVAIGVLMLLVMNPEWAAAVAVQNGFEYARVFLADVAAWFAQVEVSPALVNSGLGIVALVFAGLIGGLLYGLHRGENAPRNAAGA